MQYKTKKTAFTQPAHKVFFKKNENDSFFSKVPQQTFWNRSVLQTYRPRGSVYFGEKDTPTLKEDSFNKAKDKAKKPWIETINVKFSGKSGAGGDMFPTGEMSAKYRNKPRNLPSISNERISGGSAKFGFTDQGKFTVGRIEGLGYNDVTAANPIDRKHWRLKHYGKKDADGNVPGGSMEYAVFFNRGQALHAGSLTDGSHSCVHVDWNEPDMSTIRQINYHSVSGLTKVNVEYDKTNAAFKDLCCERKKFTRGFRNPCNRGWNKRC